MGKLVQFPDRKSQSAVAKLLRVSDQIDAVLIKALTEDGIDPKELAGLLSHRLGSFMRSIEDKDRLWAVCEHVVKRQANI